MSFENNLRVFLILGIFSCAATSENRASGYPCPNETIILPCTCSYYTDTFEMTMNCRWAKTEDELRNVFNQELDFYSYYKLDVWQEQLGSDYSIDKLSSGVFGACTFEVIFFDYHDVQTIDQDIFDNMKNELFHVHFNYGSLMNFIYDFTGFPLMRFIDLNHNSDLTQLDVISPSLSSFEVYNGNLDFNKCSFDFPSVTSIDLASNNLKKVPKFSSSVLLQIIHLGSNAITSVDHDDLSQSQYLTTIDLYSNDISRVDAGSMWATTYIYMGSNQITTLEEDIWRPIVENITNLSLHTNPLTCGCDIQWLFTSEMLINNIMSSATCADGSDLHAHYGTFSACP